jgi:hypothetical protein
MESCIHVDQLDLNEVLSSYGSRTEDRGQPLQLPLSVDE